MKRCYLVGAGEWHTPARLPTSEDVTVAVDGGYAHALAAGLAPTLLVGDMDSLGEAPQNIETVTAPVRKDDTDMALAMELCMERGCDTFYLLGATGGRTDHTYANLQLLHRLAEAGRAGYMDDGRFVTTVLGPCEMLTFGADFAGTVSVFCMAGEATGVTERGLSYSLTDGTVRFDRPLGVSNAFVGQVAEISVREGFLTVLWERQEGQREPKRGRLPSA